MATEKKDWPHRQPKRLFDLIPVDTTPKRTSSFSPSDMSSLEMTHDRWENARTAREPAPPPTPRKVELPLDAKFTVAGRNMDMNPYELQALVNAALISTDETVQHALKRFLMTAKLTNNEKVIEVRKDIAEREAVHERNLAQHRKDTKATYDKINEMRDHVRFTFNDMATKFLDILIKLETTLSRNPDVSSLGDWDRWFAKALCQTDGKVASITKGKVKINLTEAKRAITDPEFIQKLLKRIPTIKELERQDAEYQWMTQASAHDLKKLLWHPDLEPHTQREIMLSILERHGIMGHFNQHGELQVYNAPENFEWEKLIYGS